MTSRTYTIGQVSRLSGLSVKRLRFYADEKLLPPACRTESGYRLFTDEDLVRLDLIKAFREAGFGLAAIRDILARPLSLAEALALRLREVEAQIATQKRVAATLRAALSHPSPTPDDVRRVWTMTNLSQSERRAAIEDFFAEVTRETGVDPGWTRHMIKLSTPDLPDEPTQEQIDAWIEISRLISDPEFIEHMRANAHDSQAASLDSALFETLDAPIRAGVRAALAEGLAPDSPTGRALSEEFLVAWARATGQVADGKYRGRMKRKHLEHRPKTERYWTLVFLLRYGDDAPQPNEEGRWLDQAVGFALADA